MLQTYGVELLSEIYELNSIMCFSVGAAGIWVCSHRDISIFGDIEGIHVLDIQYKPLVPALPGRFYKCPRCRIEVSPDLKRSLYVIGSPRSGSSGNANIHGYCGLLLV